MATPDEDFSGLPLQERLVHKSWKARSGAYDELSKIFATLDPDADAEYKKWQDSLKAIVADSNAVAQETGLGAVMSYVTNAPNAKKTRSVLASSIVDKCLGSVRAGTRQKALDVLLMYIEIDVADPIIEEILPSLAHKNPKNVTAAITALREAIRQFGTRVVSVKPIVKQLPKIFDHKDKNVRAEGTALAMELHRWLGAALISTLNDLKPVQLKELTEQFAAASTDKATPERLLRSEQVKATVPQVDEDLNGDPDDAEATEEPDAAEPLDLFDPVNVLDKLPKDFYEQLASAKWKDRKEALEALYEVAKAPKLEDGRYGELVGALGKRINDANLLVVTASANCIAAIAGGLRTTFTQYKSLVVTPVIEKFKEKKQTVVDALRSAVDAVYLAAGINSIAEDIVGGVGHKNPQVRTESLKWATRSLKDTRQVPGKPEIKILSEALAKALDDSDAGVRESAAEAFGTFMKVVTERVLASTTEKIDHLKLSKVKEYFDKAEIRAKAAPPPAAKKVAAKRPASAPAVKPLKPAPPGQPKSNSPPPRKSTTAKAAAPKQRPSAAAAPVRAEDVHPDPHGRTNITDQVNGDLIDQLCDAQWDTRKAGLDRLAGLLRDSNDRVILSSDSPLFAALKDRLTDTNKNLALAAVEVVGRLAAAVGKPFAKPAKALVGPIATIMNDSKAHVRGAALPTLMVIFQAVGIEPMLPGLAFALEQAHSVSRLELLKWIVDRLDDTGELNTPNMDCILHATVVCMGDKDSSVRRVASELLAFIARTIDHPSRIQDKAEQLYSGSQLQSMKELIDMTVEIAEEWKIEVAQEQAELLRKIAPADRPKTAPAKGRTTPPKRASQTSLTSRPSTASSRPASRKAPVAARSSAVSRRDYESSNEIGLPLISADFHAKESRSSADRGLSKWSFDAPRREFVDLLANQSEGHFSPEVHGNLFASDHHKEKKFLAGLTSLDTPIANGVESIVAYANALNMSPEDLKNRYTANSDLLLKYITLRFFDTNTSMFMKSLELCEHLFTLLDDEGYHLTEYEATSFIPYLINKVGDPKETMRARVRAIFKQLIRVYPASKLFTHLMKGLESKNARTRAELLDELQFLIQRNGVSVCNPNKIFPIIATHIADRDATVRNGAIGVVCAAHQFVGEAIYKHIGKMSDKDKSLVEERLKRVSAANRTASGTTRVSLAQRASPTRLGAPGSRRTSPKSGTTTSPPRRSPPGSGRSPPLKAPISPASASRLPTARLSVNSGSPPRGKKPSASPSRDYGKEIDFDLSSKAKPKVKQFTLDAEELERGFKPYKAYSPAKITEPTAPNGSAAEFERTFKPYKPFPPAPLTDVSLPAPRSRNFSPVFAGMSKSSSTSELSLPQSQPGELENRLDAPHPGLSEKSLNMLIVRSNDSDLESAIVSFKEIEARLHSNPELLTENINALMPLLGGRLAYGLDILRRGPDPAAERFTKHIINTMVTVFQSTATVLRIKPEDVHSCMNQLLYAIHQPYLRDDRLSGGHGILRVLNVLVVRVLDKVERETMLRIIFTLIMDSSEQLANTAEGEERDLQMKHQESIQRCVWKLSKTLPGDLDAGRFDLGRFFADLHELVSARPSRHWHALARDTGIEKCMVPVQLMKTTIHKLAVALGEDLLPHLRNIPAQETSWVTGFAKQCVNGVMEKRRLGQTSNFQTPEGSQGDLFEGLPSEGTPRASAVRTATTVQPSPLWRSVSASDMLKDIAGSASSLLPDLEAFDQREKVSSVTENTDAAIMGAQRCSTPESQSKRTIVADSPRSDTACQTESEDGRENLDRAFKTARPDDRGRFEMRQIMNLLNSPATKAAGLKGMQEFQKQFPNVEEYVQAYLDESAIFYRKFIMRQLAALDGNDDGIPVHPELTAAYDDAEHTAIKMYERWGAEWAAASSV